MNVAKRKALAVLGVSAAVFAVPAAAQTMGDPTKRIVGTWTLAAADDVKPDGTRTPIFGPRPKGMLIFDEHGRYSLQICSAERPKIAANSRTAGTAEENQALVKGCNPHWGRYTVEGENIVFHIDHAFFPNWEGTKQARSFTLAGDELSYSVPSASIAGTKPVVVWKRAALH